MTFRIRYRPGTDLALRFNTIRYPQRGPGYTTREHAEKVRAACPNAADMEIYDDEGDE